MPDINQLHAYFTARASETAAQRGQRAAQHPSAANDAFDGVEAGRTHVEHHAYAQHTHSAARNQSPHAGQHSALPSPTFPSDFRAQFAQTAQRQWQAGREPTSLSPSERQMASGVSPQANNDGDKTDQHAQNRHGLFPCPIR